MPYSLFADIVLVAHLGFVLFAALGGLLALRWPLAPLLHLPAVAWGAFIEITGGVCPLTPLENRLREAAGGVTYDESFIEHYLVSILYPSGLSRDVQFALAALLLLMNLLIYGLVWRRRAAGRRRPRRRGARA